MTSGGDANPWGTDGRNGLGGREQNGKKKSRKNIAPGSTRRQSGKYKHVARDDAPTMQVTGGHDSDGNLKENVTRPMPKIANPGNCIIVKARVGGGHMGSTLCHENEAPFPEDLAEFFVLSFCPPAGTVCDPYSGSGTTAAVSVRHGRNFIGCDLRQSQVDLALKRLANETPMGLFT